MNYFLIVFLLLFFSCTVLNTAPKPELANIKYSNQKILDGKMVALKISDIRKSKKFSDEFRDLFTVILEKQFKGYGAILDEKSSDVFELKFKNFDIANSNIGCTVIISYEVLYSSKHYRSTVTKDQFPCIEKSHRKDLSTSTVNKMLVEIDDWLKTTLLSTDFAKKLP